VATAYLPADVAEGEQLAVEALGDEVSAEVAPDCLWDPSGARARA
jgi:glycine cleavage system aminomethyltransferase T